MSVFEILSKINVSEHTEKKNGLTYLSWAWAWAELLKNFPDSTYTVYENAQGWFYHTDGRTAWVKTGVTVEGKEYIEMLPVMDYKNRSIPLEQVTSTDVNKAIQRSLTKAVARHGLGLYIYAGEDLPECDEPKSPKSPKTAKEPEASSRIAIVNEACSRLKITMHRFGEFKLLAAAAGVIPDGIMVNALSDEDFSKLLAFVEERVAAAA